MMDTTAVLVRYTDLSYLGDYLDFQRKKRLRKRWRAIVAFNEAVERVSSKTARCAVEIAVSSCHLCDKQSAIAKSGPR